VDINYPTVLTRLHARFDAIASGADKHNSSWLAHAEVVDRLDVNRRHAETLGWTSCNLQRDGGLGRLRMFGCPPGGTDRSEVPDEG